jgi:hypothetical protein
MRMFGAFFAIGYGLSVLAQLVQELDRDLAEAGCVEVQLRDELEARPAMVPYTFTNAEHDTTTGNAS